MPLENETLSKGRLEFSDFLSESEIKQIVADKDAKVLQTKKPVKSEVWRLINDKLIKQRSDIEIRIYGHYSEECDLSVLECLSDVKNLSIDCLMDAINIDAMSNLSGLESLSVGIYSLDNFDFLTTIPATLNHLFLGVTKSKKPDLSPLERFTNLKDVYIEGQNKHLEVLGQIHSLKKLVLRSVSPKDISFIRKLNNLWSLDIKLGGIRDLSPLHELDNIKYLELWQVRGLSDISVISSLTGLQYLFLQSLKNVTALPDMSRLHALRRVYLETMKGLTDVSGVFKAPALEEYIHVCAQNMEPEQYSDLLKSKMLKKALFGFGSDKKNTRMYKMMKEKGIDRYKNYTPFDFK
jgi:hypothetical protein